MESNFSWLAFNDDECTVNWPFGDDIQDFGATSIDWRNFAFEVRLIKVLMRGKKKLFGAFCKEIQYIQAKTDLWFFAPAQPII